LKGNRLTLGDAGDIHGFQTVRNHPGNATETPFDCFPPVTAFAVRGCS
jgi:hypothetical protein